MCSIFRCFGRRSQSPLTLMHTRDSHWDSWTMSQGVYQDTGATCQAQDLWWHFAEWQVDPPQSCKTRHRNSSLVKSQLFLRSSVSNATSLKHCTDARGEGGKVAYFSVKPSWLGRACSFFNTSTLGLPDPIICKYLFAKFPGLMGCLRKPL